MGGAPGRFSWRPRCQSLFRRLRRLHWAVALRSRENRAGAPRGVSSARQWLSSVSASWSVHVLPGIQRRPVAFRDLLVCVQHVLRDLNYRDGHSSSIDFDFDRIGEAFFAGKSIFEVTRSVRDYYPHRDNAPRSHRTRMTQRNLPDSLYYTKFVH